MKKSIICVFMIVTVFLTACNTQHQHTWSEANCTAPKTCVECGAIEGVPLDHEWNIYDNYLSCAVCSKIMELNLSDEETEVSLTSLSGIPFDNTQSASEYIDLFDQNNIKNTAIFLEHDGWIYGQGFDYNGKSQFVKVRTDGSDWTVLDSGTVANIHVIDGYVYYTKDYSSSEKTGIYKMRASGTDKKLIVEAVGNMQIYDGSIYYSNNVTYETIESDEGYSIVSPKDCHLYKCDLNGKNITKIISKPVFYHYVFDDKILYQDDNDKSSLHMCDLDGKNDIKINDQFSFCPIYDGEFIYYTSDESAADSESPLQIWKVRPDGSENQKVAPYSTDSSIVLSNKYIYFINSDDGYRIYRINKDGSNLTLITQDGNIGIVQLFGNSIGYRKYSDDLKYVDGNYFCNYDGSGKWDFADMKN